jgi:hypothetical protein
VLRGVRTDDYSLSAGAGIEAAPGAAARLATLSVEATATLTGTAGNELSVIESLRREEADSAPLVKLSSDLQAVYDWSVKPAGGVPLPLVPSAIAATGSLAHRESAGLTIGWQDSGPYHPLHLLVGHSTTLTYADRASIKAGILLGVDAESVGSGAYSWRVAGQLSLEGTLKF